MNQSETKAYEWLIKQGYSGIVFHRTSTPDFTTDSDAKFEVKKVRNNTIYFSPKQFDSLNNAPNTKILVFDGDGGSKPVAIIPFTEISDGRKFWKNIRIVNPTGELILLRVNGQEKQRMIRSANALGLNLSAFIRLLVHMHLDKE